MEIYTKDDIEAFGKVSSDLIDKIEGIKLQILEPTKQELDTVANIVLDFIIDKRRKLYGGTALNMSLKDKNPKDAIYGDNEIPDLDFYSPDPIKDLMELCNILHDKGYSKVEGKEAQHKGTYSIFVNYNNSADISYVPRNVYNRMPFITVDKVTIIHPHFVLLDMMRMFSDPILSASFRWVKSMNRIEALQKHFPLMKLDRPINIKHKENPDKIIMTSIINYICDQKTIIMIGFYAYNVFANHSGMKNKKLQNLPYYEFISTQYKKDGIDMVNMLKSKFGDDNIRACEYYPFFQLYGYNCEIYYKDIKIVHIYSHAKRCTPYKCITCTSDESGKRTKDEKHIKIGSFQQVLMMNMALTIHARTNKIKDMMNVYQVITSNLLTMKKQYLKNNNKTIIDDTIFQDFVINCTGETIDSKRESFIERDQMKKEKKKMYIYRYNPAQKKSEPESNYRFPNLSGNAIRNSKNLRLIEDAPEEEEEVESENDT